MSGLFTQPTCASLIIAGLILLPTVAAGADEQAGSGSTNKPPEVGQVAPDFVLADLEGEPYRLSELVEEGPVVVVVLRGYPGYQCPLCSLQVSDLTKHADAFKKAGAQVLLVYPGASSGLAQRGEEFLGKRTLPDDFALVLDPDYALTEEYGLRWDAPQETAYPSTFVIDGQRTVRYALVSKTHGGRAKAAEVLKVLSQLR